MSRDDTVLKVGALVMSVAIVAVFLGTFMGVATDLAPNRNVSEDVTLYPNGEGQISYAGAIENLSVNQSLGTAAHLTGANDSQLSGGSTPAPSDETWTVTTWGRLDENASTTSTRRLLQLGGWLYVDYNDSTWRVTYYDEADLTVHQMSVNATSPQTWTQLQVVRNGSTMTIYTNATAAGTMELASGGAAVPNASNWYGSVEETRAYDQVLDSSERNTTYDTPTAPIDGRSELFRVYYDARDGETTYDIYRTGTDLSRSNATTVAGFDGQPLSSGLLSPDYSFDSGTLSATDGGRLDGAPVAFVSYTSTQGSFGGVLSSLTGIGRAALTLVVLGGLAMAGQRAMQELGGR